jgi:hypothetical protein
MSEGRVRGRRGALIAIVAGAALIATSCGGNGDDGGGTDSGGQQELVGLFKIDQGECSGSDISGSYFRMIQSGGKLDGPFVTNGDSACKDKSYTAVSPGSDGGMITGEIQGHPDPALDGKGNGTAANMIQPQPWFAVAFGCTTNSPDMQTEEDASPPKITFDGEGKLTGETTAYSCAWNGQFFNQGAPKPDGSSPGLTSPVSGTYDPDTGRYTLEWTSTIVGGAFDKFTGVWHLEGVFEES